MKQVRQQNVRQKKRPKKTTLVFNEESRKEFLGGFHKRKILRQKNAQKELQQKSKIEKMNLKQNARQNLKKMTSYNQMPITNGVLSEQEFELAGRKISILELPTDLHMETEKVEISNVFKKYNHRIKMHGQQNVRQDKGLETSRSTIKSTKIKRNIKKN